MIDYNGAITFRAKVTRIDGSLEVFYDQRLIEGYKDYKEYVLILEKRYKNSPNDKVDITSRISHHGNC